MLQRMPRAGELLLAQARARRVHLGGPSRAGARGAHPAARGEGVLPEHDPHSFAVRKFLEWIRAGKDVDAEIPALSAYMGHKRPASTYWYLSAVPELLYLVTGHTERFAAMQPARGDA